MTLMLIVGLALGGAAVYAAYRDQKLGAAIVVGLTVVTVFFLLMDRDPSVASPQTVPPSSSVSTSVPSSTQPPSLGQQTP
ncbi:hypothetical protein [Streptomyces sp. NPDC058695]|uniref:hypothetical protein n=1 Tax=Streptomyces sp. NPDC058695 TaxID=3346604 RepID=UPI003668CD61